MRIELLLYQNDYAELVMFILLKVLWTRKKETIISIWKVFY